MNRSVLLVLKRLNTDEIEKQLRYVFENIMLFQENFALGSLHLKIWQELVNITVISWSFSHDTPIDISSPRPCMGVCKLRGF